MQRLSLTVVLCTCLAVAGCSPSASQKLVGKWKYDALNPAEQPDGEQDTSGAVKDAVLGLAQAMGMKAGMEIEFKDDQTMTTSASWLFGETSGQMRWKVVEVKDETVTVEVRRGEDQNASQWQITFIDQDHFRFTPPGTEAKSIVFTRVKQE